MDSRRGFLVQTSVTAGAGKLAVGCDFNPAVGVLVFGPRKAVKF